MATSRPNQAGAAAPDLRSARFARVNLLPERTLLRHAGRRRATAWMITNGLIALAGLGTWQWSRGALGEVVAERTKVVEQRTRVQREERIGGGLGAHAAALQRQLATLDALRPTDQWAARLARIANAVPEGMLLTQIAVPPARAAAPAPAAPPKTKPGIPSPTRTDAPRLTIAGFTANHDRLAEFLRRLQQEAGLRDAELVRSALAGDLQSSLVQFEISATR